MTVKGCKPSTKSGGLGRRLTKRGLDMQSHSGQEDIEQWPPAYLCLQTPDTINT